MDRSADVSDRIALLSAERQELLSRLRRAGRRPRTTPAARPAGSPAPLSYAQRRLWFVHQLGEGSVAYSAPVIHRIRGPLDVPALTRSLRQVVNRHEALRTVFPERDGEPVQLVRELAEPVLRLTSVEHLPADERERAADDLVRAEAGIPFDLVDGPVLRTTAIRIAPDDHLLVLNIHHITSDQWSMGVLVRELTAGYRAYRDGRTPDLPELPVSYSDYTVWQRERMTGPALAGHLRYWQEQLAGLPVLDLPTDRPRPPLQSDNGAQAWCWLPAPTLRALQQLAGAEGMSPFMTLLAGFVGLLSRYTGADDIAVGTTVPGRETEDVAGLIGFFVNTLVLRADLSGDPTFRDLLGRVRHTVLSGHEHQHLPFDLLVEHLHPVRDPSRPPLVSVMFQQDNTPDCALELPGLDIELVDDFDPGTAKYDLLVSVRVWDHATRIHVQYNTDLFDADTVERLLSGYQALMHAAIAEPEAPLRTLPILSGPDAQQILVDWNDTAVDLPAGGCLHELVERHTGQRPTAVAAVAGGRPYTFAELDARANQLAHHLVGLGVAPGQRVALHLPGGADHLIAVLATLKAGGAYVPVDPDHPAERVAFMLADSAAAVVVTTAALADGMPAPAGAVVRVDGPESARIAAAPTTRPCTSVTPDDACYVIYTSGSTGTPKGVVLRHRGVVNNLVDLTTRFGVGPGDSVLALSSPSFDMSVYELLGVPGAGGTVVIPEPELLRDPAHWSELLLDHGVTVWNSAPALLEMLLDHLEQSTDEPPATVRLALLGGDWIPVGMPGRLRDVAPGVVFVSLGGATEASIHSIVHRVDAVDPHWTSIPYGRPMANQRAYLLDEARQPVPVGVPGELYLGGVGLAAGYLNRPELTAAKFVQWRGQRLYRTGDLARWRCDGTIELLGRKDFMIKLNGLRIEPGEIESVLRGHDRVADAVVVARTDTAGDRCLAAYVVSHSPVDADELRRHVERRLPAAMVPASFVTLDALPLSPNGKVDRRALASYEPVHAVRVGEPPAGPLEERIAEVWREVLGVPEVNRCDDFFALGGDSFKAVRVARALPTPLPVVEVFRNPTIAELAEQLARAGDGARRSRLHRLTPGGGPATVNLVCVPYGGGNAVAYQPLADALDGRIALWAVDLPGHDLSDPTPLAPIPEVGERLAESIRAEVTGPVALYGQCAGAATTLDLARRLEDLGVPVLATFMGAALPDTDPERSWRMIVDGTPEALLGHLRRLGGFDGALDDDDVSGIMRVVHHDLTEAVRFYLRERTGEPRRLAGPVHCVIGDADPATEGYRTAYRDWARYGSSTTLSVVPGGGHYFCKHQPADVAEIVARRLGI